MRICIVPEYPMSLMTGGLQVQAQRTFESLRDNGVPVELFEWSSTEKPADLYHFIGLPAYLEKVVELVRTAERPYVLTLLFGSNAQSLDHWMAAARQRFRSQILRDRRRYDAIIHAEQIITITEADARAANVIYGIEKRKIQIVPNGVSNKFHKASPEAWINKFGVRPFVLCVGAIQPRKGQLLLAEACNALKLPVVLLGPVLPGHAEYGERVRAAVQTNTSYGGVWLESLTNEDSLLQSAYAACRLFVLLSNCETQPLSVLEAMAARKPVLLLRANYTQDALFKNLPQIPTATLDHVVKELWRYWEQAEPTDLPGDYSWPAVAEKLLRIYKGILPKIDIQSA